MIIIGKKNNNNKNKKIKIKIKNNYSDIKVNILSWWSGIRQASLQTL